MPDDDLNTVAWLATQEPPVQVPIASLIQNGSARSGGLDGAHIQRLAEVDGQLPPILVHRPTRTVVDGSHRIAAALTQGHDHIEVRWVDGSLESAFILGVRANAAHGLPLSLADRRNVAIRILQFNMAWSDRAIASVCGLSAKTVREIRSSNSDGVCGDKRRGIDGKLRPLNSAAGRQRAAELIAARPEASLREIASAAGVAPGTVRDVRARLARGEDPVPTRSRRDVQAEPDPMGSLGTAAVEVDRILATITNDPALRMSADGRNLIRWFHAHVVHPRDCVRFTQRLPDHCLDHLAKLAHNCARNWALIARTIDQVRTEACARKSLPPSPRTEEERPTG